jgi:hypothetical protein
MPLSLTHPEVSDRDRSYLERIMKMLDASDYGTKSPRWPYSHRIRTNPTFLTDQRNPAIY